MRVAPMPHRSASTPTAHPIPTVMIGVLTNVPLMRAQFAFKDATSALGTTLERLATGKRVNRAADDPSAITPITQMSGRMKEIEAKLRSLELRQIEIAAKDGATAAIGDMAIQLQSLIVEAGNRDTLGDATLAGLQGEMDGIIEAIAFTLETSRFRGQALFSSSINNYVSGTLTLDTPPPDPDAPPPDGPQPQPQPEPETVRTTLLDLKAGGRLDLIDGDLEAAKELADALVDRTSRTRGNLGNVALNEIDSEMRTLREEYINLAEGRSQLEDTDYAEETANLVRQQILQEASIITQNIAKEQAETALVLLEGATLIPSAGPDRAEPIGR